MAGYNNLAHRGFEYFFKLQPLRWSHRWSLKFNGGRKQLSNRKPGLERSDKHLDREPRPHDDRLRQHLRHQRSDRQKRHRHADPFWCGQYLHRSHHGERRHAPTLRQHLLQRAHFELRRYHFRRHEHHHRQIQRLHHHHRRRQRLHLHDRVKRQRHHRRHRLRPTHRHRRPDLQQHRRQSLHRVCQRHPLELEQHRQLHLEHHERCQCHGIQLRQLRGEYGQFRHRWCKPHGHMEFRHLRQQPHPQLHPRHAGLLLGRWLGKLGRCLQRRSPWLYSRQPHGG